jgi:hypothetical protein
MLKNLDKLDMPPNEFYEPTPQLGWFINKSDLLGKPILYQIWSSSIVGQGMVWVKVTTYIRNDSNE